MSGIPAPQLAMQAMLLRLDGVCAQRYGRLELWADIRGTCFWITPEMTLAEYYPGVRLSLWGRVKRWLGR